jgi:DNA-binding GntR family transcriptional regulator
MSAIKKKSTRKKKVSQKEEMEKLVALLQDWQKLEARGIKFLNALQKETENKVINEVLEIIKCDSRQHRRVQQFLIDGLTKEAYSLAVEEVSDIADKLAEHDKLEEEAIEFAKRARITPAARSCASSSPTSSRTRRSTTRCWTTWTT